MFFFNTPKFWYKKAGYILSRLGYLIYIIRKAGNLNKKNQYKCSPNIPVIAVGGCVLGGSGKTPAVIEICNMLKEEGLNPIVCTRGYGRKSSNKGAVLVNTEKHSFKDVGDEPLLLAKYASVCVASDRSKCMKYLKELNSDCIVLDDGLEQKDVKPTIKVLVIDGLQGIGNGLPFPAGPLRGSFSEYIQSSDIIIFFNSEYNKNLLDNFACDHKIFKAKYKQDFSNIDSKKELIAFSGIGMNEKFFTGVRKNLNIVKTFSFPDHYPYKKSDILKMKKNGLQLVTTEKDYQRIDKSAKNEICYVPLQIEWEDKKLVKSTIKKLITHRTLKSYPQKNPVYR